MSNFTLSDRLSGVGEYYFSKKNREIDQLRAEGHDVINFGIGSPDCPPHPIVIAKLAEEAAKSTTHTYQSYSGAPILRKAFAEWYEKYYNVKLDGMKEILPLIGSKEGLMHICMTYVNKGDKVLIPNPGYPTYRSAVTLSGGEVVEYHLNEENGWLPDFDAIDPTGVKLMIMNYPNMPTGTKATAELFERAVKFAADNGILLVHDNPYSFIRNDKPLSLLQVEGAMETALELNSLSKSHNMAGWRVGMIAGKKERLDEILRFKSNMDSGMFYPMQAAAAVALTELGDEWYEDLNAMYREREKLAFEMLDLLGCKYNREQAGLFVWARMPEGEEDCFAFSDKILYNCDVFITPGAIFGSEGQKYIRVCLCAPEVKFIKAIEKIRKGLKL
ncbi:MAG: aminotransferase class I/II-fold pyridoxal phosphate-dependent enzyme [Tidjanibacter sp.]|nr:aminotransferase class I/II-fold pyridoxal phosphate-dependent enzyme [Tidjanibacter sp.]MBR4037095.1 aminotransferase class I/II-fold pyridoxal phosphate-dependent enzyme [Tidjanibacter sp.]MBR4064231.1 aminotransferase class I/II-fold pyridoxal phosphate-dependent enzyme [Tidjanibacter sp.]MBR6813176.1 aminotransferase class I/II-fold pyridoxal phosphate-dependent enzyme [Tidjanibacter sp.]MBR7102385.1 aminotransferase class I/II-fold pyridoxal phosphate-dependent enzyme [Tidjanibacter sp.